MSAIPEYDSQQVLRLRESLARFFDVPVEKILPDSDFSVLSACTLESALHFHCVEHFFKDDYPFDAEPFMTPTRLARADDYIRSLCAAIEEYRSSRKT